jgi:hypothetical protein
MNESGLVNLGLTYHNSIDFDNASIPVNTSLVFNPRAKKVYLMFNISL